MMNREKIEGIADNMDAFNRAKYYMNFYVNMLSVYYTTKKGYRSKVHYQSVNHFFDKSNIVVRDNGINWEAKRFAQRYTTIYYGAYSFISKGIYCKML